MKTVIKGRLKGQLVKGVVGEAQCSEWNARMAYSGNMATPFKD